MTATDSRADWLAWRQAGIGGSDIAAAATGRYGGAYRVVADKLGIRVPEHEIDPVLADRGLRWEQPIADGVHAHTGLWVAGEQMWHEHDRQPRWRYTGDGLLLAAPQGDMADVVAGLEVKTRGPRSPWAWDYWRTQPQWGMVVTGLPRYLLAVATIDDVFDEHNGNLTEQITGIRYEWIYADPALQSQLIELANWLLGLVDAGELPEPTGPEALPYVKAANAEICPNCDGTGIVDDEPCVLCGGPPDIDDLAELLARYEELREAAKHAEDERKTAEAKIRARMGDAIEAVTSDGTWRVRCGLPIKKFTAQSEADFLELYGEAHPELIRPTLDRKAAKTDMPDEYDALRIPTPDRRLTIKHLEDS